MQYFKAAALAGVALLIMGCEPKGAYQQAAVTGRRLDDTRSQLITAKTQISQTVASLDDLVQQPEGDLKTKYQAFSDNVDKLNKGYATARDRLIDMRANRDAYLAQWNTDLNSLQSDELRERARQRMSNVKDDFSKLGDKIDAINTPATPLLADLNDLRRYFGSDLTATGVKSVPDIVARIHTEATETQSRIDDALTQLDTTSQTISPSAATQTAN